MIRGISLLVAASLFVRLAAAQASGWENGQVSTTMCMWETPRAAVIRDTLYIDGGELWWQPGMADGSLGGLANDGNPLGLVYLLNFSTPFNTSQNISTAFTTQSKVGTGQSANNIAPLYVDGAMFANDYDWVTYGGLITSTSAFTPPAANAAASYLRYASGPPKQFFPGYQNLQLPDSMTRYVTYGAAVSVPSENLGFYFGGLRAASFGPISYQPGGNLTSQQADVQSLTMMELDMSSQENPNWTNHTLVPSQVPGRAGAELVWVPVSEKGILVAIGGVIFPTYDNPSQTENATSTAQSQKQSPTFMSTVAVYDIAGDNWYEQATNGTNPGQLTQGCTVLASAPDGSSHNIYWYGGYDGLNPAGDYFDDVYVLSIPSFTWVKVSSGTTTHGRAGHRCAKPYPDQMIVVGGYRFSNGDAKCLDGGILQIFNLSSAEWMTSYDPSKWSDYKVPSMVSQVIGGSGTGSATLTAPAPSGFSNSSLEALFKAKYNESKITTWYPYHATPTNNNNGTTPLPQPVTKSSTPSYLAPVLGVVLGLIFVSLVVLAILLYRRRRALKVNGTATQSEAGTMDNRRWVTNWLRSTPVDPKAPTVTTDDTPMTPGLTDEYSEEVSSVPNNVSEMGGVPVVEMADTSRPIELHDTGLNPIILGKRTSNGRHPGGLGHSPSAGSRKSNGSGHPDLSPGATPRADSPPLGQAEPQSRIASELSGLSESDRGHLRGISETSVSTDGGAHAASAEAPTAPTIREEDLTPAPLAVISPLTPPQGTSESGDYVGAGAASSTTAPGSLDPPQVQNQNRKSNFSEKLDDSDGPEK